MTTTFKCIPAIKMLTLAVKAAEIGRAKPPFGSFDKVAVEIEQHNYIKFSLAICEALSHVNYDSMGLDMEQIQKIAKEQANFEEYDMFDPKHGGKIDQMAMVESMQKSVFFERYAHLIAAELKGPTTSKTNVING